jgi:hypothetical protein
MSLDNIEMVDAVGTENSTNTVVLSIMDSWDWEDQQKHLAALQDKLNAYFGFVESGQIYEAYPEATGKSLRIDIISRYPMPEAGHGVLAKASDVASKLNMSITQRVH